MQIVDKLLISIELINVNIKLLATILKQTA